MAQSNPDNFNIDGIRIAADAFVVIVRTDWNAHVVDLLQEGAVQLLQEKGVNYEIISVPGAVEISFAIKAYWELREAKPIAAFIALGCVIRGDTPHFEYVCHSITNGITQLNLLLPVPVIFGVLTVNNQVQADERTGGRHGHKGEEAAATALKMIALTQSFKNQ